MIPIGVRPILWHVMRYYAHFGHKDFVLCLGYRADVVKSYFLNYSEAISNDFVMQDGGRSLELLQTDIEDWRITFADTGVQHDRRASGCGPSGRTSPARRCSSPTTATR